MHEMHKVMASKDLGHEGAAVDLIIIVHFKSPLTLTYIIILLLFWFRISQLLPVPPWEFELDACS